MTRAQFDRDPLAAGAGYAGNGESRYTRCAARGEIAVRRDPNAPRSRLNGFMPADEKIRRTQIHIGIIEGKLAFERDPQRRAKLEKDLRIKNVLLLVYGRERNDPNYRREKIRV